MTSKEQLAVAVLAACGLVVLLQTTPADAQTQADESAQAYVRCMAAARTQPEAALKQARDWAQTGGGGPAKHCEAVALISLGRTVEAAQHLERLAGNTPARNAELREQILAQAGRAWLMAGEADRALATLGAALALDPDNIELLIDRSIAAGTGGRYWEAVDDLNHALDLAPDRPDILILRASAYRALEALDLARDDLDRALGADPDNPDGLLERGNLRRMTGEDEGAAADWRRILEIAPESPAAEAARANLRNLAAPSAP